ncbi:hypothetical protein ACIQU6_30615 [Streptomyces sp. NPDC090442]|uniref:hypothetical protein n=1 Tax=Streptomyces sp. NPDC090442 TaxID=3365962 RepID=UPI0038095333
MTSTPLTTPSRRRRHARLIELATRLVGECATAAGAIYGPIAAAAPDVDDVEVSRGPLIMLAASVAGRIETAWREDDERWPTVAAAEELAAHRCTARRHALAEAEAALTGEAPVPADTPGIVPELTPHQIASLRAVGVGGDYLTALDEGPDVALDLLRRLTAAGEHTAAEVLDDAVDTALISAVLTLGRACQVPDPSHGAELALEASRHLVLAVRLASADPVPGALETA